MDVFTYRKGKYEPWPEDSFIETKSRLSGKPVTYRLSERSVLIGKALWMREVRRLCDSGHQTSVMTTRQDLSIEQIASRMSSRWSQENFFRYMRHEYNLDHMIIYDVEQADGDRLVPNPQQKDKAKAISKMKAGLEKLQKDYGQRTFENKEAQRLSMRGVNIANAGCKRKIKRLQEQIDQASAELKKIPKKVPLKSVDRQPVRLEKERKYLSDVIKMTSYRVESSLLNLLYSHFVRAGEEGRTFLKSLFELPADIIPDEKEGVLGEVVADIAECHIDSRYRQGEHRHGGQQGPVPPPGTQMATHQREGDGRNNQGGNEPPPYPGNAGRHNKPMIVASISDII